MRARILVLLAAGCTSLGPMPSTTVISPVPAGSPGLELGVAYAPGYYLSSGVTKDPKGTAMPQASLLFEPDRLIHVPGLFAGVRAVGPRDAGTYGEPMLGYRSTVGERLAFGVIGYGTHASAENRDASYSATRLGVEVSGDVRVTPESRWLELHLIAGAAATGILADGTYCIDSMGQYGVDCPEPPDPQTMVSASASGIYPSGHAGAVLAFGQHLAGVFHGGRITLHAAAGTMPTAIGGVQESAHAYAALGLSLSLGLGAAATASPSPAAPQ